MADPDIQLGSTSCGGSRHSARGNNLICFPVSHVYLFLGGGQSLHQTGWGIGGPWSDFPLSGSATAVSEQGTWRCPI